MLVIVIAAYFNSVLEVLDVMTERVVALVDFAALVLCANGDCALLVIVMMIDMMIISPLGLGSLFLFIAARESLALLAFVFVILGEGLVGRAEEHFTLVVFTLIIVLDLLAVLVIVVTFEGEFALRLGFGLRCVASGHLTGRLDVFFLFIAAYGKLALCHFVLVVMLVIILVYFCSVLLLMRVALEEFTLAIFALLLVITTVWIFATVLAWYFFVIAVEISAFVALALGWIGGFWVNRGDRLNRSRRRFDRTRWWSTAFG